MPVELTKVLTPQGLRAALSKVGSTFVDEDDFQISRGTPWYRKLRVFAGDSGAAEVTQASSVQSEYKFYFCSSCLPRKRDVKPIAKSTVTFQKNEDPVWRCGEWIFQRSTQAPTKLNDTGCGKAADHFVQALGGKPFIYHKQTTSEPPNLGRILKNVGLVTFIASILGCAASSMVAPINQNIAIMPPTTNPLELITLGSRTGNWLPIIILVGGILVAWFITICGEKIEGS
ncbi:hypothetical protein BH10CYA1_BH10CYA1_62180 [soil metagenome]